MGSMFPIWISYVLQCLSLIGDRAGLGESRMKWYLLCCANFLLLCVETVTVGACLHRFFHAFCHFTLVCILPYSWLCSLNQGTMDGQWGFYLNLGALSWRSHFKCNLSPAFFVAISFYTLVPLSDIELKQRVMENTASRYGKKSITMHACSWKVFHYASRTLGYHMCLVQHSPSPNQTAHVGARNIRMLRPWATLDVWYPNPPLTCEFRVSELCMEKFHFTNLSSE